MISLSVKNSMWCLLHKHETLLWPLTSRVCIFHGTFQIVEGQGQVRAGAPFTTSLVQYSVNALPAGRSRHMDKKQPLMCGETKLPVGTWRSGFLPLLSSRCSATDWSSARIAARTPAFPEQLKREHVTLSNLHSDRMTRHSRTREHLRKCSHINTWMSQPKVFLENFVFRVQTNNKW